MGVVGSGSVANFANTEVGYALDVNAVTTAGGLPGQYVGGAGEVNQFSGGVIPTPFNLTYLDIKDSSASPGAYFYAANSVNSGNNAGWTFV